MSARDKIKNANMVSLVNEHKVETIVDDIQRQIENMDVAPEPLKKKDPASRRRKFADDAVTKFVSVQLLESEVKFLEKYGGEFGGKTGYIRRLVQQEMSRVIDR